MLVPPHFLSLISTRQYESIQDLMKDDYWAKEISVEQQDKQDFPL